MKGRGHKDIDVLRTQWRIWTVAVQDMEHSEGIHKIRQPTRKSTTGQK